MIDWLIKNWKDLMLPLGLLAGWLIRKYDILRLKPREKVALKSDEQKISSNQINDAALIVKTAIESNGQLMAQLSYVNALAITVQQENETNKRKAKQVEFENEQLGHKIEELTNRVAQLTQTVEELNYDLTHCLANPNCEDTLKKLKEKYGLT